jgi:S1-C subfamily serine protease
LYRQRRRCIAALRASRESAKIEAVSAIREKIHDHLMGKCVVLLIGLVLAAAAARAEAVAPVAEPRPVVHSSDAESTYAATRPRLLQIRTLVVGSEQQSSIGSGFLVSADGLAITNYHVVSEYALDPGTYRLEYRTPDDALGEVKLLAIDLANDLALIRVDRHDQPFLQFDISALDGSMLKGERLYSMGVPLDLGFAIVEGTFNGTIARSYSERIHFSGALNPGMSGGPAVTGRGTVAGVNVAKQLSGELVSFLVPARFAAALLDRARDNAPMSAADLRAEIGRQLTAWQAGLYTSFDRRGFHLDHLGPYDVPESAAPWFTCWGHTNIDNVPKPRATVDMTSCESDTGLFVAHDLNTGIIRLSHAFVKSVDLNDFQFAAFLSREAPGSWLRGWNRKWQTKPRCREDFLRTGAPGDRPVMRVVWCALAYREFAGLYDISVTAVTEDRSSEALVSRLSLQGIGYDKAEELTKRFLDGVQWTK